MGQAHLFGNENGASESLLDSLSFVTKLSQDFYKTPVKTPTAQLQHSYQETTERLSANTALLSRDYSMPIKKLRHHINPIFRGVILSSSYAGGLFGPP